MTATANKQTLIKFQADAVLCRNDAGALLDWIVICPPGNVSSKNADFVMDNAAWMEMDKAFREHGASLEVDLLHESVKGDKILPKDRIGAMGWIEDLAFDTAQGLKAKINWNEEGKSRINSDRFRYLSPALWMRPEDRRAIGLHSVGLVNQPAIKGMGRVVLNEDEQILENQMNPELKLIANALGAADTETPETLASKIGEIKKKADTADAALLVANAARKALELPDSANAEAVTLKVATLKESTTLATNERERLKALETQMAESRVDKLMEEYKAKINPNDKEKVAALRKMAANDPESFHAILKNAPDIVEQGRTQPPGEATGEKGREFIINSAVSEFRKDASLGKFTTCADYVSLKLQDAGKPRLSAEEAAKIAA